MKKNLFKIAILSTIFTFGVGLSFAQNTSPSKAKATQYLNDYAPYTYNGNYYNSINFDAAGGQNGALRQALTAKIKPAGFYSYSGQGETHLATQLQYADEDPTDSSKMVYLYTRDSVTKNSAQSWNREHCWPQSLSNGNWGESQGGTDILHLRPTYQNTNSSRGNKKYGDINKQGSKYFNSMLYGYANSTTFEPVDQVKGDVARIIMYVWTTYTGWQGYNSLNILSVFDSYDTLLKWHTLDRPDVLEGNRNNYVESSKQKNRNPFVDHPELAWKIFGDNASASVKTACMNAYPASSVDPITPTGVVLNELSGSLEVNETLQLTATLQPSGASGTITWSSSNTTVATVSNSGLVTARAEGSATITARVTDNIGAECLITVTKTHGGGGGGSGSGELEVTNSIQVGDVIYLTANEVSKQYSGPSSTSTVYGIGVAYEGVPSTDETGLEVVAGNTAGSYALRLTSESTNKYLYWASGNSLNTNSSITNNSSWNISFDSDKNATITNVADSSRTIWWNFSSPRFACYTGDKSNDTGFRKIKLWKSGSGVSYGIDHYLAEASSVASLFGTENVASEGSTDTVVFEDCGYENAELVDQVIIGSVTLTTDKFEGNTDPAYYNTGKGLRIYGHNMITFDASTPITRIEFVFSGSNTGSFSPNVGTYSNNVWTGSSTSVNFVNESSSQARIQSITVVTGSHEVNVTGVNFQFAGVLSEANWNIIDSKWGISDYGVMLVKETTLEDKYELTSVQEAFEAGKTLAIYNKGNGTAPTPVNGICEFAVKINMTKVTNYNIVYCGLPFIVADDTYYFFDEMRFSVVSLAQYYYVNGGSTLSDDALLSIIADAGE